MNQLEKYKIQLLALQEVRWRETGSITRGNYTVFYSGGTRNFLGTGFAVQKKWLGAVLKFTPKSDRLCSLRLKGELFNVTLVCVHAPTEDSQEEDKDAFYSELEALLEETPGHDVKIVLGDFNAKIGKEQVLRPTVGGCSLHDETNDNGLRVVDFAASKGLVVSSTMFPHKNIHKVTWYSADGVTRNQIDHVLIDTRHATDIQDVRAYRGADADSDHALVRVKYRQRICRVYNVRGERQRRFDTEKLKGERIQEYVDAIEAGLQDMSGEGNVEGTWHEIKSVVRMAAEGVVGFKKPERREGWFDAECRAALELRNEARERTLQRETRYTRQGYVEARKAAKRICRSKKRAWQKGMIERIEECSRQRDIRGMYAGIRREKQGFQARTTMCEDKSGNLITETSKVLDRWAEHFMEVLNDSSGSGEEEQCSYLAGPDLEVRDPSLTEVEEALKRMKNHKAPGEDMITAELLKKGGRLLHDRLHALVLLIWREEKMPEDWEVALICPIHKKGSKFKCDNYRGVSLLSIGYKLLTRIITSRLDALAEGILGDYQCGFRRNRSTTDQIFSIRCLLEKAYEYNMPVHQLYIDYTKAYDSVRRSFLFETMDQFGIPRKIIRLVQMTLRNSRSKVKVQQEFSRDFTVNQGLRQGDPLSCVLFNLTLERLMRNITISDRGTLRSYLRQGTRAAGTFFNQPLQYLAYADDVALLGRTRQDVSRAFLELETASREAGLRVSQSKTKFMTMAREGRMTDDLVAGCSTFENARSFKYLGTIITEENENLEEIKERIGAGNRCYFNTIHLLKSRTLSRSCKKVIYKTVIRPVVTYGSETWVMTKKSEELLNMWERKILRKIFGPVCLNGEWRIRTNDEVYRLYEDPPITTEIKRARIRWLGHVERMPESRGVRQLFRGRPSGRRLPGRPRKRWLDDVEDDLRALGVRHWRRCAVDRNGWRDVVEQAKALREL